MYKSRVYMFIVQAPWRQVDLWVSLDSQMAPGQKENLHQKTRYMASEVEPSRGTHMHTLTHAHTHTHTEMRVSILSGRAELFTWSRRWCQRPFTPEGTSQNSTFAPQRGKGTTCSRRGRKRPCILAQSLHPCSAVSHPAQLSFLALPS